MKAQIVSFHCVLRDNLGQVISSTINHDVLTYADHPGKLLKGLAEGLKDLRKGDRRTVFLTAEQAYGFYDPNLINRIPRTKLSYDQALHIGQQVIAETEDGKSQAFTIIELTRETVTLDGNHPLAGKDLFFEIETLEVREATYAELSASAPLSSKVTFH